MKYFCHKQRLAALLIVFLTLFSSTALAARYSTLEYGDQGEDVLKLQKAMLYLGYDPSGTVGKFGRGTERAVKRYQTANKLEADGKAGNQTLTLLCQRQCGEQPDAPDGDRRLLRQRGIRLHRQRFRRQ